MKIIKFIISESFWLAALWLLRLVFVIWKKPNLEKLNFS